ALGHSSTAHARELFKDMLKYRQWLRRELWPRMPMRPVWRFGYMYLVRGGFLDGRAGWHLAWLMGCYEYMIGLLYREKLARVRGQSRIKPRVIEGAARQASQQPPPAAAQPPPAAPA